MQALGDLLRTPRHRPTPILARAMMTTDDMRGGGDLLQTQRQGPCDSAREAGLARSHAVPHWQPIWRPSND
jgi:hypothetical protein